MKMPPTGAPPSTAEELLAELARRGVAVALHDGDLLLEAPAGALAAELLGELRTHKSSLVALLGERRGPLTGAQRQLWFLHQVAPDEAAFNVVVQATIRCPLHIGALQQALTELVRRHEVLRTRFESAGAEPTQVVAPPASVPLPVVRVQDPAGSAAAVRSEANRPFCLAAGPPFRAALVEGPHEETTLVLAAHHIVLDGMSVGFLLEELSELYSACRAGEAPELPPPAMQHLEVAREREGLARTPGFEEQLRYWRTVFAELPDPLDLPTDRPRPEQPSFAGERIRLPLPPDCAGHLRALRQETAATPFVILLAAVSVVLSRWSGLEDFAVGVPFAHRPRRAHARLLGMFVETLAVRVDLSGTPSFSELVQRVRAAALGAFANAGVPLVRVVAEVAPDRQLTASPLFRVMFSLEDLPRPRLDLDGLETDVRLLMPGTRFDLTVYASLREHGSLDLEAAYCTDLFARPRIEELLRQVRDVLVQVAADPRRPVRSLSLRTAEARARFRPPDARADRDAAAPPRVHEACLAAADRWPERVAISGAEDWTYGRLRDESSAVARRLPAAGAQPGDLVAVEGARGPRLVAALLGVLEAGAGFVVLDPAHPERHRRRLLDAARPRAWVAADGAVSRLSGARPPREDGPAHLAFTSGTTAHPRGVLAGHGPLAHFVSWYTDLLGVGEGDRFAMTSGITHDPLLRDVLVPLAAGARLCVPPEEPAVMGPSLLGWVAERGVTVLHLTPALARLMTAGATTSSLDALRRVVFGGDVLRPDDVARWHRLAPRARLYNAYGATETPQIVGLHRVDPELDAGAARVPIGRGVPGVQLVVAGPDGTPCGVGELGELRVVSAHLAWGYLDDDGQTRRRFVDHPTDPAGRQYRTGDLGRYRPDGGIELVRRADRQVQVRGARVEPAGVEDVLRRHAAVADAALVAAPNAAGETSLTAYVVPSGSADPEDLRDLHRWLRSRVPASRVPSRIVPVGRIPVTGRGKVDSEALSAEAGAITGTDASAAGVERALAAIWSGALGVAAVDPGDDFFTLGGDSLLAVYVVERIRESLGVSLPLRTLFEAPSVAGLARALRRTRGRSEWPALEPVDPAAAVPATCGQLRMWAPERAGGAPYHIVRATRLLGPLDEAALDRALVALERRHEALRTRFDVAGDEVLLRVGAARDTVLERCDEAADAAWSVDLTRQAPWRARLRGGPDAAGPQLFEVCAHHAAVDGRSFQRLVVELGTLYEAFAAGRPSPLPAVAWGARDFAAWQARCRERGRWDEQLSYWRRQLSGLERLRLPATTAAPAAAPHAAGMQRRPLDRGLAGRLAARARAEASTPFMATLAAYGAVLHRWSGQPDLAVGTPFGARPQGGAQGVVGMFVNRLALRLDLSGSPSLREVLRRTRDTVLRAFANADVPLEHVAGALDLPEGPEETPLFQAFFNQLDVSGFSLELPGVACTPLPAADRQVARFDLALYAVTDHRRQELVLVHDLERLGAAEAGSFLEDLVVALTALADSPRTAVGDLPSTTASQNLTGS